MFVVVTDGPADTEKKHGEKANVAAWAGKNVRMRLHSWEAEIRDKETVDWWTMSAKEREAKVALVCCQINDLRAKQVPQEKVLSLDQIRHSIANNKAEDRHQNYDLLDIEQVDAARFYEDVVSRMEEYAFLILSFQRLTVVQVTSKARRRVSS